nr:hypothetical protein [Kofleriaceae bacterium]
MERRGLALVFAVLGLICLGYAGLSQQWLGNVGYSAEVGVGLRDAYACDDHGSRCETIDDDELVDRYEARVNAPRHFPEGKADAGSGDDTFASPWDRVLPKPGLLDHASGIFPAAGMATFVLIAIAMLMMFVAAAIAAAGRRPQLPVSPCSLAVIALALDLLSAIVFVTTKPGPTSMLGVGTAFWVFGGGVLVAMAGSLFLARAIRPHDPDLLEDAIDPEDY